MASALASALLSLGPPSFLAAAPVALPLLLALAPAAQAQTVQTLVGNSGTAEVDDDSTNLRIGVKFTTGSSAVTLTEVRLIVQAAPAAPPVVRIRDGSTTDPTGAIIATLNNPSTFTLNAQNSFTAPADITLAANTTYFLSLNDGVTTRSDGMEYQYTSSTGQPGVTGWSIADTVRAFVVGAWRVNSIIPTFEVHGRIIEEPAGGVTEAVQAWQVRFGRTVAQQVVDAVQDRFSANPQAGLNITVAGEDLTGATALAENEGALSKLLGFETVSGQQLAQGSSFSFSPEIAVEQGPEHGEGTARFSLWGQGALSSFRGQEAFSLHGDVSTALLGADWRTERWHAGAALSHSWGNGGYEGEGDNDGAGDISSTLLGLFPYGRYALTPRLGVWAVAGYGWGSLSVKPDDGSKREYKLATSMVMGAVGMDGLLIDGAADGFSLSTTTDLLTVKTTTEQVDDLSSTEGSVSRLRLGLEATRPFPLANDAALLPSLEIGIRHDGGDAESGFGLEVGAGIAWSAPQQGITAEVKGRSLLTHADQEFRQQGLALSFAWQPNASNRGPSLSLGHTMGAGAAGGMDALLNPTVIQGVGGAASNGQRFKAEVAYGFPAANDRLTLTPGVAVALSPDRRSYGILWSLAPYARQGQMEPWEIALAGEREERNSATSPVDHSLGLRFSLLF
ncbi:MAG: autotransporter outer membrane beta-barrel domain-containing protein [Cyanobacteria bacterium MAG CAR3_bin_5]|nr:autotransporter outer membrane beta-barrel domain-containing protein [Cyanobacteria bacterium MAG CAR3_bin_5]